MIKTVVSIRRDFKYFSEEIKEVYSMVYILPMLTK